MRTKEFLSIRGIEFESVNILEQPEALEELAALGVRTVPVVSRGKDFVFGQMIADVAGFVGVALDHHPLPPVELLARLDNILAAAIRYVQQIPDPDLSRELPGRKRSYRQLVHHIFIVPTAFLDSMERGSVLSEAALAVEPDASHRRAADLAAFGTAVKARLNDWWLTQPVAAGKDGAALAPDRLSTYYGDQAAHPVFERTVWHAGQHVRQLMAVLATLNLEPETPLTDADFAGLPMPSKVWDDDVRDQL